MVRIWVLGLLLAGNTGLLSAPAKAEATAPAGKQKAIGLYKEGKKLVKAKKYLEAAAKFAAAYKADPTFPKSLYREAYCYRKAKKLDLAAAKYKEFIAKSPNNPDGHFGLAETYRRAGKKQEAVNAYKKYLVNEKRPKEAKWVKKAQKLVLELGGSLQGLTLGLPQAKIDASGAAKPSASKKTAAKPKAKKKVVYLSAMAEEELLKLAEEKMEEGDFKKAAEAFSTAYAKNPSLLRALFSKGIALQKGGKFLNARTTFEAYDKKFPNDPDTVYQLAETERLMGNIQRAGSLFQRYLKLEGRPNRAKQVNRAKLMTKELLGTRSEGQASNTAAAVKQTADSPLLGQTLLAQSFLNQAKTAAERKDRSMAMHLMSLAVSYAPMEPAVHEKRGKILLVMNNSLDAENAFQTAINYVDAEVDKQRLRKWISKARRQGHSKESEKRIVSKEEAETARTLFAAAETKWSAGDTQGALEESRQATQYDPNWVASYVRLGECLLARDENEDALNVFRQANLIEPQNESIVWGMAMSADGLGDRPLANDYFRLYLQLPGDVTQNKRADVAERRLSQPLY